MATDSKRRVFMLPWLAHGHVTPFVELGKKLHRLGHFHVYLCSTPVIIQQQKKNDDDVIEYVELELLPSSTELPSHYQTTKDLPTHLMPNLKTAFDRSESAFDCLLRCQRPDLVIYDFIQPWAPVVCSRHGIPSVLFLSTGATAMSFLLHHFLFKINKNDQPDLQRIRFPLVGFEDIEDDDDQWVKLLTSVANGLTDGDRVVQSIQKSTSLVLIRSFEEIESKFLSYLCSLTANKQIIPVGPLLNPEDYNPNSRFVGWLERKKRSSVVFASFGSEYFMSKDQIFEITKGLEFSQVNFIFVVRFPLDSGDHHQEFLENLLLDDSGRGLIVEGWAPQKLILGHPSVGGFVTHCGWSSVLEAMAVGVPIIAMPMQLDQPFNARLVSQLGVGVEVQREDERRAGACIYGREEMARKIELVMGKGGEGLKIRAKVTEMAERLSKKGDDDLDVVVKKLVEVCTHCS